MSRWWNWSKSLTMTQPITARRLSKGTQLPKIVALINESMSLSDHLRDKVLARKAMVCEPVRGVVNRFNDHA
jgi:hypothetical protein